MFFFTPMRSRAAIPCAFKRWSSTRDSSRHDGLPIPCLAAARTILAVSWACSAAPSELLSKLLFVAACNRSFVTWNPCNRSRRATHASSAAARRKILCAGAGSFLNRRSRSHIGRVKRYQTIFGQTAEQFRQIAFQQVGLCVVLFLQLH